MNMQKSHCQPPSPEELEQLRQKYGTRKRRFNRAARLAQIMYTLTACGSRNMRNLAQIIAGYTGEDPEIVRRILYRYLKLLTDLWFVEKRNMELRITPIGLYVIARLNRINFLDRPFSQYISRWIASRLEEWEEALCGLRVFLENLDAMRYLEMESYYPLAEILAMVERGNFPKIPLNLTEKEVLYNLLNFEEIRRLDKNDPVLVLHNLSDIFAPYFVGTYLYELHKDLPEEFERALMRHDARLRKVAALLRICSYKECPEKALDILLEDLFEERGLLYYLNNLNLIFLEKMTKWPQGKPPLSSALALITAGVLLPHDNVEYIILALKKSERKMNEFLATILVAYSLELLMDKLSEISLNIAVVSKYRSSVIPRAWALKDERYRELLSAILMLDKVLNEQLEFSRGSRDSRG
ncbi:MAG: hypothetical protein GSR81_06050 [Desulfurococcales archaeon]|nr:hypothetical protein [Desulfurococcales archaeon]